MRIRKGEANIWVLDTMNNVDWTPRSQNIRLTAETIAYLLRLSYIKFSDVKNPKITLMETQIAPQVKNFNGCAVLTVGNAWRLIMGTYHLDSWMNRGNDKPMQLNCKQEYRGSVSRKHAEENIIRFMMVSTQQKVYCLCLIANSLI